MPPFVRAHADPAVLRHGQVGAGGDAVPDVHAVRDHPLVAPDVALGTRHLGALTGVDDEQGGDHVLAEHVVPGEIHAVGQRGLHRVAGQPGRVARETVSGTGGVPGVVGQRLRHPVPAVHGALYVDAGRFGARTVIGSEAADVPVVLAHAAGREGSVRAEQHAIERPGIALRVVLPVGAGATVHGAVVQADHVLAAPLAAPDLVEPGEGGGGR